MKRSIEIKQVISNLQVRRDQLEAQSDKANQANERAQGDLIKNGTEEAIAKSARSFAAYSSLQNAIEAIDTEIADKQQQLEEAELFESQESSRIRAAECEQGIAEAEKQYREGRLQAHAYLMETLPAVYQAWTRRLALLEEHAGLTGGQSPTKLMRKRNIDGLESLDPFDDVINLALQVLANVANRGTREERKAKMLERNKRAKEAERIWTEKRLAAEARAAAERGTPGLQGWKAHNPQRVA